MKPALLIAALAAMAFNAHASDQTEKPESYPPVTLENSELRSLDSEATGQAYKIMVAKPFGRPQGADGKFPVIYVLDGDIGFAMTRQIAMSLQFGFEAPPALIVGIAYAGDPRRSLALRARDFTPTFSEAYAVYAKKWEGSSGAKDTLGGAPQFLTFMREELAPFIEENYPVNSDDATLIGASFGGLFAAYTLFTEPDTFQRYILSSPSLWWDDRMIFDLEAQYAQSHRELNAAVFIAAGGRERKEYDEEIMATAPPPMREAISDFIAMLGDGAQMVEVIEPFVEQLEQRDYDNLSLEFHIFPDETHGSTPPMAISRGLRTLFADR